MSDTLPLAAIKSRTGHTDGFNVVTYDRPTDPPRQPQSLLPRNLYGTEDAGGGPGQILSLLVQTLIEDGLSPLFNRYI